MKEKILKVADKLFNEKGYDKTSVSDILKEVGIARGTLYYYFESKESIMDALIESYSEKLLSNARKVAKDKTIPVKERLLKAIMAMNLKNENGEEIINHLNKPQNVLMNQKVQKVMIEGIPEILTEIVKDGIDEGIFNTPYPYESMEMIIAYVNIIFDSDLIELTEEEYQSRIMAVIYNLEKLLGAKKGSLSEIIVLFN